MAEKSKKPRKSRTSKTGGADEVSPVEALDVSDAPGAEAASVEEPEPETLTVDQLVGAARPAATEPQVPDADSEADSIAAAFAEEPVSDELKAIVEALVFASPDPLTPKALCKLMDSEPAEEVQRAIEALKQDYLQVRGLHLVEIAGGLQIVTRPDLNEWVRRLFHERKNTRLSVQALESLAVIAYRQPVTAAEITEIRGVNASGVLSTLVERKLIKTAGRKAVVGRPFLYATTREFLLRFGLNDVDDLPKVEDLADALGFELPGLLNEALPTDQMLPLGDPDELTAPAEAEEPAESPGEVPGRGQDEAEAADETAVPEVQPADETPLEPEPPGVTDEDPGLDEPAVPERDPEA